jgi:hypothetical protein
MSRLAVSTPRDASRRAKSPAIFFASTDFEIIDLMLKHAGFAGYDILFGQGGMVLAYTRPVAQSDHQRDRRQPAAPRHRLRRSLSDPPLGPRHADRGAVEALHDIVKTGKVRYIGEDQRLTDKLLTELPGILNWAIVGWRRLTERGYFRQPQSALDAVQPLEDLSSPIGAFLRERCVIAAGHTVKINRLFKAWTLWCTEQGRDHSRHGAKLRPQPQSSHTRAQGNAASGRPRTLALLSGDWAEMSDWHAMARVLKYCRPSITDSSIRDYPFLHRRSIPRVAYND